MNEQNARSQYQQKIDRMVEMFLPNGAGTITEPRFRHALDQAAQAAFTAGQSYALLSLMTAEDVAESLGVSARRIRAIAQEKHERFGIGYKVPGSRGTWLFRPEEVDHLRPGPSGRPKK